MGIAAAGAMGWLGARGNPQGIPAGVEGVFGGGVSGGFSGGVLGAMIGAGAVGLAAVNPTVRRRLGSGLATAIRSRPVRHFADIAAAIPSSVPGAEFRAMTTGFLSQVGGMPQHQAMRFLEDLLTQKSWRRVAMGATTGVAAGAIIGGPLGAMRRAYQAGERQVPSSQLG